MHKLSIVSSIACTSFLLSGCVTTDPSSKVEKSARAAAQAEVVNPNDVWEAAAEAGDVEVGWINSFQDATLAKLVEESQANNKNLQAAAVNVERSLAMAQQAGAALKPGVNLLAGGARSGSAESSSSAGSSYSAGLQVDWELDVWGRVRSGAQAALASAESAAADYRFAQHSLAAATAKTYFTNIEANLQVDIARENLSILENIVRIVRARLENDIVSSQDMALSESDLAVAREGVITLEGAQWDAARALEVLLGRYPSGDLAVGTVLPDVPANPPVGVPSEVLERRPDLIAAERRVASAFNALDQAKAARLPTLQLTSSVGGASGGLSDLLSPENMAWNLGTNLLAPIFDGGVRRAQVEISNADQKQALAAYGQVALEAFQEVEGGLDQGVVLSKRLIELVEAEKQISEAYRVAELRYKEGEVDLFELLTMQQRVVSARSNLASVQRLLLDQRVNLNLALGGSWE